MISANLPADKPYSKAFECFVESPDDIIGLLAYALYKQDIQEARREGRDPPASGQRNPGRIEVKAFRSFAERSLEKVIETATKAAEPQWVEAGREQGRLADKSEILSLILARTGFLAAVGAGVLSWLLSIGTTVLVVYSAPGWVRNLTDRIDQSVATPAIAPTSQQKPSRSPG